MTHRLSITTLAAAAAVSLVHALAARVLPPPHFSPSGKSLPSSQGKSYAKYIASRRLAPIPLLLIGLAALAVLVIIPWVVHAQTPVNQDATGRPVVLASAQGAGILFADTKGLSRNN